jgi:predicted MPP superfamily phosphohydrolase
VLADQKKVLYRDELKTRKLPSFRHFSVSTQLSKQILASYFPNDAVSVDRGFAWAVFETLEPAKAEKYYHTVLDERYGSSRKVQRPAIELSRRWLNLLLKHEPKSGKQIRLEHFDLYLT